VISIVACCHGVKLCTHAARAFRSHQNGAATQDVKVVLGSAFTQRMYDRCSLLKKGGDVVATTPLALHWNARFATNRMCAKKNTRCIYAWYEQAIIEGLRCVISIVACCHGGKLCAHAALAFRSHHFHTDNKM